jgi:hypothetical protein
MGGFVGDSPIDQVEHLAAERIRVAQVRGELLFLFRDAGLLVS